jgi:hypothetical protein
MASNGDGSFSAISCTLAAHSGDQSTCSVTYTPAVQGSPQLAASYAGDATHTTSSAQATLAVSPTPPPIIPPVQPITPPPAPAPQPAPPKPTPPSNAFSFGKLTLDRKHGRATLGVNVPDAGKLVLSRSSLVKPVTKTARAKGTLTLAIAPTSTALKTLHKKRKLSLKITLTFTPTGGTARAKSGTILLRLSL